MSRPRQSSRPEETSERHTRAYVLGCRPVSLVGPTRESAGAWAETCANQKYIRNFANATPC
eukprot:3923318-Prymnesium_polylepis.1